MKEMLKEVLPPVHSGEILAVDLPPGASWAELLDENGAKEPGKEGDEDDVYFDEDDVLRGREEGKVQAMGRLRHLMNVGSARSGLRDLEAWSLVPLFCSLSDGQSTRHDKKGVGDSSPLGCRRQTFRLSSMLGHTHGLHYRVYWHHTFSSLRARAGEGALDSR